MNMLFKTFNIHTHPPNLYAALTYIKIFSKTFSKTLFVYLLIAFFLANCGGGNPRDLANDDSGNGDIVHITTPLITCLEGLSRISSMGGEGMVSIGHSLDTLTSPNMGTSIAITATVTDMVTPAPIVHACDALVRVTQAPAPMLAYRMSSATFNGGIGNSR